MEKQQKLKKVMFKRRHWINKNYFELDYGKSIFIQINNFISNKSVSNEYKFVRNISISSYSI